MTRELKKTPLFEAHIRRSGKMVEFAGWQMPLQFEGIRKEHHQVRKSLGLFDVSHMGEIRVRGKEALKTLQWLTTNDVSKLQRGQAQYSLFPNEQGGIVDDLVVYCLKPEEDYLLCVNAANTEKDLRFLMENNRGAIIEDESNQWGQMAIQGPLALDCLEKVTGLFLKRHPDFCFLKWSWREQTCLVARTGYTGENGVEIFVPWELTEALWEKFFREYPEAAPIGLGARDTLRMEMAYPLYGQDISDTTFPQEVGLGWVVKSNKGDFMGRSEMMAAMSQGTMGKRVGIELTGKGIARSGHKVFSVDSKEVGIVTSGTLSPSLDKAIAVVRLFSPLGKVDETVFVEMRNKRVEGKIVKTPFYRKEE